MVLFVSSPCSELTRSAFAGNSSAVTTKQATAKSSLRMTRGTARIQNTWHDSRKSISAGRATEMERMFFFYSFKAQRRWDSFRHFKPTAYVALRHFKKWN